MSYDYLPQSIQDLIDSAPKDQRTLLTVIAMAAYKKGRQDGYDACTTNIEWEKKGWDIY